MPEPSAARPPEPAARPGPPDPPPGRLRHAWQTAMFYPLLLAFALLSLGWSLPAALLAKLLPARIGEPLGQRAIGGGFRLYLALLQGCGMLRADFSALDALRDEEGLVIAPNHPSLLDAVVMTSRLPRVVCIAKASIWHNPLLGGGMRLAGYVRNDAPLAMIRNAAAALRAGRQVLIFPEGTRTPPGAVLGPVTRSFALLAQQAGAPVQTVIIEMEPPYLGKGWPPLRRPPLPLRVRVRLGARFPAGGDARSLSEEVARHLGAQVPPRS